MVLRRGETRETMQRLTSFWPANNLKWNSCYLLDGCDLVLQWDNTAALLFAARWPVARVARVPAAGLTSLGWLASLVLNYETNQWLSTIGYIALTMPMLGRLSWMDTFSLESVIREWTIIRTEGKEEMLWHKWYLYSRQAKDWFKSVWPSDIRPNF